MKSMKSAMKSSGMTLSAVYSSVAETTGLKQKQARGVVEGIMGVAADQLKKNGAFRLAGIRQQPRPARASVLSPKSHASSRPSPSKTVRVLAMKKLKESIN